MNYEEYVRYHRQGDAGVEERMIASLCRHFKLSSWDSFRLIYYYTMTYHIPSALEMLAGEIDMKKLKFRTDRRYVRCNGAYDRLLKELSRDMHDSLLCVSTTQEAYDIVKKWYFFGRYASFLFLEVYINVFRPKWTDNIKLAWEKDENYTKGAILVARSNEKSQLDIFLNRAREDCRDNAFSIETSLCAVEKIKKGTRWNGYYTERMLADARGSKYESLIYKLAK
ncbi:MAG: hypothetical protein J6S85_09055 [Methanobrevibacter sp.]|nr:hypothetical protein [Methanobrevibacter sp.]